MIAIDPREFMAKPSAHEVFHSMPVTRRQRAPQDFSCAGDGQHREHDRQVELGSEVDPQTHAGEEQRREDERHEIQDRPPRRLAEVGRVTQGDPHQERAENGVYADPLRQRRRQQRQRDGKADHAAGPARVCLDPGEKAVQQPAAHGQHQRGREQRQPDRHRHVQRRVRARSQDADDHREHHPADEVVEQGRRDGDGPQVAAEQVQVDQRAGDLRQ
jgi:hypothetical protein